jgi:oxygen-independent coproporphyrinogen III oxidase
VRGPNARELGWGQFSWEDRDSMNSLGIYISVPFCRSKCTYCNFASGVFPEAYQARYIDRVIEQIWEQIRRSSEFSGQLGVSMPGVVDSVYLGGGTPSILAPELLRRLFVGLRNEFEVADGAEVTLECAPGQLEDDVLRAMVECGVNRVSFGIQSFINREAAVTGRLHTCETALRDIDRVREAGIRSINADLIAGLPHQTANSWRESLETLIESGVDHASIYMLEVDEDSRLGRELLDGGDRYHAGAAPDDEMVADCYLEAIQTLGATGLAQYEISNFARPGSRSRHNMKYWTRQPYLGFGLDAHSMLRSADEGAVRFRTGDDLGSFLEGARWEDIQPVPRAQALEEAWFLGLRLNEGVSLAALAAEFGEAEAYCHEEEISDLAQLGLLEQHGDWVRLTDRGRLMSNDVFGRFVGEAAKSDLVLVD